MVIVSSSTAAVDQQNAYTSGADSYLIKPTDLPSMREQLSVVCQRWTAAAGTA
jgi:DNA-binding response OmpR family regulator